MSTEHARSAFVLFFWISCHVGIPANVFKNSNHLTHPFVTHTTGEVIGSLFSFWKWDVIAAVVLNDTNARQQYRTASVILRNLNITTSYLKFVQSGISKDKVDTIFKDIKMVARSKFRISIAREFLTVCFGFLAFSLAVGRICEMILCYVSSSAHDCSCL